MTVEADVAGIDFQKAAKYQLCVPSVQTGNDSFRFKASTAATKGRKEKAKNLTPV